jgi:hypothetical protein
MSASTLTINPSSVPTGLKVPPADSPRLAEVVSALLRSPAVTASEDAKQPIALCASFDFPLFSNLPNPPNFPASGSGRQAPSPHQGSYTKTGLEG